MFVVQGVRQANLTDRTTISFEASVNTDADPWRLTITTNLPAIADGAHSELRKAAAREVELELRQLPSERLGTEPFGRVAIPMALTWGVPREGVAVQTQVLYGEPLFLLDVTETADYYLVQGVEGYTGWVRWEAVERVDRATFTALLNGGRQRVTRHAMVDDFNVPPGSIAGADGSVLPHPGASPSLLPSDFLHPPQVKRPGMIDAETAMREFLYTPYVFGGRSTLGLDCSGLVGVWWTAAGL